MQRKRRVASYQKAIDWIVQNDDTEWLADDEPIISVSAALVGDLFGRSDAQVIKDLRRTEKVLGGQHG